MTTYEVVRLYREEFDNCLPKFLLTGNTKIARRNIPTMYATIKYKCFRHAQRVLELFGAWFPAIPTKTCEKDKHSCVRNVVSFGNFPGRLQLRAVSRSLRRMTAMIYG